MVNIAKIKTLAKAKGISQTHICSQLGMKGSYLTDVANGKNSMSEERVRKVAHLLGTSFEYLMDITDDPDPNFLIKLTESTQERIEREFKEKIETIPEEQRETVLRLLRLPEDEFDRALQMLSLMWQK